MSLINDALKKAQRQQLQPSAESLPPMPGGGRIRKRGEPMAAQTIVLIVAASAVLVVLSVVGTVFLLNRPTPPKKPAPVAAASSNLPSTPAQKTQGNTIQEEPLTPIVIAAPILSKSSPPAAAPAPIETKPAITKTTSIAVVTPAAPPPKPTTTSVEEPVASTAAAATPSLVPATTPAPTSVTTATPVVPAPRPSTPAALEEGIHVFIDSIRLKGVRATGSDSRVLMNDHVYRLNDFVDRSLGLRLTKVESDKLTFTDASGATYEKNF